MKHRSNVYDRIDDIESMARKLNRGTVPFPKSVILKHLIISIEKDLLMVVKQWRDLEK